MDQIYPDNGLVFILESVVQNGLTWHLFANDIVPSLDDDLTRYTESAWSGYAPITLLATDFTFEQVDTHVGQVSGDVIAFLNSSGNPQTVYGYFITDVGNTILLGVARFDDAPRLIPDGQECDVFPGVANFSGLSS